MKKVLALCLALVLAVGLMAGCGKKDTQYKIGVVQLVTHPALDAAYQGFVDGLAEAGYEDGKNITINYQNAQGEMPNCATIADTLVNDNSDLILAIATPAAQAVATATSDIPILVTAVTDPADAGLVQSNEAPGTNVSGTSDLTPVKEQMELLLQLCPDVQTVGMLYTSSEDNSVFQVNLAKAAAQTLGLTTMDFTISDANTLQQVVESMVGKVDAIYSPTDNLVASAISTVAATAIENDLPFIVGEEGMVNGGGLASYSISYYELGRQTARMAVEILEGGKNPADMPVQYQENLTFIYNPETAAALGITIPDALKG